MIDRTTPTWTGPSPLSGTANGVTLKELPQENQDFDQWTVPQLDSDAQWEDAVGPAVSTKVCIEGTILPLPSTLFDNTLTCSLLERLVLTLLPCRIWTLGLSLIFALELWTGHRKFWTLGSTYSVTAWPLPHLQQT